jgi:hypothetical protein
MESARPPEDLITLAHRPDDGRGQQEKTQKPHGTYPSLLAQKHAAFTRILRSISFPISQP